MGKNSRRRHAEKRRRTERRHAANAEADRLVSAPPDASDADRAAEWVGSDDLPAWSEAGPCQCDECRVIAGAPGARAAIEVDLLALVSAMWNGGWQPSEIHRYLPRQSTSPKLARTLVEELIAADASRTQARGDTIHPDWKRQTDRISSRARHEPGAPGWFDRWVCSQEDPAAAVRAIITLDQVLVRLRALPKLIPSPGETGCDLPALDRGIDRSAASVELATIRGLLAKAESTSFPAEAFTVKAQAMMAAEQIDAASVRGAAADEPSRGHASALRLGFDEPYVCEQTTLLHHVAQANDCQVVAHRGVDLATVVGPAEVIGHVELLFTSLLIQVHAALRAEATDVTAGDRRRSRRFRSSFIVGYAIRIGDRLREERATTLADADIRALPVLAADQQAADDLIDRLFGALENSKRSRARDLGGLAAGCAAADRAHLREDGIDSGGTPRGAALDPPGAA